VSDLLSLIGRKRGEIAQENAILKKNLRRDKKISILYKTECSACQKSPAVVLDFQVVFHRCERKAWDVLQMRKKSMGCAILSSEAFPKSLNGAGLNLLP